MDMLPCVNRYIDATAVHTIAITRILFSYCPLFYVIMDMQNSIYSWYRVANVLSLSFDAPTVM